MFGVKITSVGGYLPDNNVTNNDLSEFLDTSDEWIVSRTGIGNRRISTSENTSVLCAKAAQDILRQAGVAAGDIDIIIVATITPDYATPSTACLVQNEIGAVGAFAFDISAACTGFVYALSIAEKLLRSGIYSNALVLGGEVLSKLVNWDDRSTAILFGDGAGGVLLQHNGGEENFVLSEDLHSDGSRFSALTGGRSPVRNHFTKIFEEESSAYLSMDGRSIFDFVIRKAPESIRQTLEKAGLTLSDISYIVPHQANYRLVEAVAKKLGLPMEKFYMNIDKYANTSAASIPLALSEMVQNGLVKIGSGDRIIITGFGGGLTWGSMLLEI